MKVQQYSEQEWAVKRWDRFNGDTQVTPTSFCQFWRTILLWATLASIPLVGKWLFLNHLREKPPMPEWNSEAHEPRLAAVRKVVAPPALFVWWLLWPVRVVLYGPWRAIVTVITFVDERDTKQLERLLVGVFLLVSAGLLIYWLVLLGILLASAWTANWPLFVAIALGVPLALAGVGFFALFYGMSIVKAIVSFFQVLWRIAVASKHRICPPMDIVRNR